MDLLLQEIVIAVVFAVIGAIAPIATKLLNRYLDRFRPSVQLALKVLPFVDEDIMEGRITEHPIADIALGYVQEFADEGISDELIQKAATEAVNRLSLNVLDRKIRTLNG